MNLPFEDALKIIKEGGKVSEVDEIDLTSMNKENLFMKNGIIMVETIRVKKWTPTQREILSEKWREVKK